MRFLDALHESYRAVIYMLAIARPTGGWLVLLSGSPQRDNPESLDMAPLRWSMVWNGKELRAEMLAHYLGEEVEVAEQHLKEALRCGRHFHNKGEFLARLRNNFGLRAVQSWEFLDGSWDDHWNIPRLNYAEILRQRVCSDLKLHENTKEGDLPIAWRHGTMDWSAADVGGSMGLTCATMSLMENLGIVPVLLPKQTDRLSVPLVSPEARKQILQVVRANGM
jgi:hypothetical protein